MRLLPVIALWLLLTACASQSDLDAANRATADAQRSAAVASQSAWDANRRADAANVQAAAQSAAFGLQNLGNSTGLMVIALGMVVMGGMYVTFAFVANQQNQDRWHREEMARLRVEELRIQAERAQRPALPAARTRPTDVYRATLPSRRVIIAQDGPAPQLPPGR